MKKIDIKFNKLCNDAITPVYKTDGAAGADICSIEDTIVKKCEIKAIKTGISVSIPEGYVITVCPRSGLAVKNGVTVHNAPGIIDSDYRGEIQVILYNAGNEDFEIKKGNRIAQLLLLEVCQMNFIETESQLSNTKRGNSGFGSTGI